MLIYLAGPLFSQAERKFNERLSNKLEILGFKVFLPQRDGIESDKPRFSKLSKEEKRGLLFRVDIKKIKETEIFLFVLDGRVPDEGACVELGIAYSCKNSQKKKLIVGLQTDIRAAFLNSKLNPMLRCCFDFIAESENELLEFLKKRTSSF